MKPLIVTVTVPASKIVPFCPGVRVLPEAVTGNDVDPAEKYCELVADDTENGSAVPLPVAVVVRFKTPPVELAMRSVLSVVSELILPAKSAVILVMVLFWP